MKRLTILLLAGTLALAGCDVLSPPTPTRTPVPTSTPEPTVAVTPTVTPMPGLTLDTGGIEPDGTFAATVSPDAPARVTFEGERFLALSLTVTPEGEGLDVRLVLRDFTNTPLVTVDRGGPGVAETVAEVQLPVTGRYEIAVEAAGGTGEVAGALAAVMSPSSAGGGPLEEVGVVSDRMGKVGEGTFYAPDVYHAYTVEVEQGQALIFEVTTTDPDVDPYFTLYDGNYNVLGHFDNEAGVNARSDDTYIAFDATYTLFVSNRGPGAGTYTVRVAPEG